MSEENKLGEMESQAPLAADPDHATELRDIVRGVARLRRWSRFSVLWIVTACLCVFGAIISATLTMASSESESMTCDMEKAAARRALTDAVKEAAALRAENAELKSAHLAATSAASASAQTALELQRENHRLKQLIETPIRLMRPVPVPAGSPERPMARPKDREEADPFQERR